MPVDCPNTEMLRGVLSPHVPVATAHEPSIISAALGQHWDVVDVLLAHGADVNHKNKRGGTMLNYARHYNGPQMVAFLKRNGAHEP